MSVTHLLCYMTTIGHFSLPEIGESSTQHIHFNFPKRSFGETKVVYLVFQPLWFSRWKWLSCNSAQDVCVLLSNLCNDLEDRESQIV